MQDQLVCEDEVRGGYGDSVGPAGVWTQMPGAHYFPIGKNFQTAVFLRRDLRGQPRDQLVAVVVDGERLKQGAKDFRSGHAFLSKNRMESARLMSGGEYESIAGCKLAGR